MVQYRDIFLKQQKKQDLKQDKREPLRIVITDAQGNQTGSGSIWANEDERRVWYMVEGAIQPGQALCRRISDPSIGLGARLGYANHGSNTKEVLEDDLFIAQTGDASGWSSTSPRDLEPGGIKNLWIYSKVITPLATYPAASGLFVNVIAGDYPYAGTRKTFLGQINIALTQNPNVGEHYYAGLYLDSANTLQVVYGASVVVASTPTEPVWPAGAFRLSVVRVNHTQTSISFSTDIVDRRMAWSDQQSGTGGWPFTKILTVSSTDADAQYTTIPLALAAASAGDVILLDAATHTLAANLSYGKAVTIMGMDPKNTIITFAVASDNALTLDTAGASLRNVTVNHTGTGTGTTGILIGANNVVIENVILNVTGASNLGFGLYQYGGTTGVKIINTFVNVSGPGTAYGWADETGGLAAEIFGGKLSGTTASIYSSISGSTLTLNGVTTTGRTEYLGTLNWMPEEKILHKNLLYHAMHFNDWQEGLTFNDIADATTYVGNLWLGVQNGQAPDVVGLAGSGSDFDEACKTTMDSANSQNGFVQFLNHKATIGLRGKTVSVSAELWGTNVANLAMNVLIWTSTADTPTKDVVGTWNNGSAHTLATNWAFGVTSIAIPIGSTEGFRYATNNIVIPTTANNIAVFISTWNNEASGDIWNFANVQLEIGPVATAFVAPTWGISIPILQQWLAKSFALTTAPTGTTSGAFTWQTRTAIAASTAGSLFAPGLRFPQTMWRTPAVTLYADTSGTSGAVRNVSAAADRGGCTASVITDSGFRSITVDNSSATVISLDHVIGVQYVADTRY